MASAEAQSKTCPWCTESFESHETPVTVGPPSYSSTATQEWSLHESCVEEWKKFGEQLFRLARIGANPALIEYPKNNGPDELLEET